MAREAAKDENARSVGINREIGIDKTFTIYENTNIMAKKSKISEQLRQAAKEAGSIYSVAQRAGMDYAALHRFISGESDMRLSNADKLAEVLGLELHERKTKRKG